MVFQQRQHKFFKNKGLTFLTGIARNRSCSVDGKSFTQVKNLEIPENGLIVHLKKFEKVKVFRKSFKNETHRYYIIYMPEENALIGVSQTEFKTLHSIHWGIECYHRAIKQVCGIGRFMVRTSEAIRTHFFSAIRAFTQLELMRVEELI